jgi:hypothetical protein
MQCKLIYMDFIAVFHIYDNQNSIILIESIICATSAKGRVPHIFCKYALQPYINFVNGAFTVT